MLICLCVCVHVHAWESHEHACVSVDMCVHVYACLCVCMYVCMCVLVHACLDVCVHMHACAYVCARVRVLCAPVGPGQEGHQSFCSPTLHLIPLSRVSHRQQSLAILGPPPPQRWQVGTFIIFLIAAQILMFAQQGFLPTEPSPWHQFLPF